MSYLRIEPDVRKVVVCEILAPTDWLTGKMLVPTD
jgi:hypothetical protein